MHVLVLFGEHTTRFVFFLSDFFRFVFPDDYRAHTSCISEAERYEGKSSKPAKKRNPQQEWMDIVTSRVATAPPHLRDYMRTMAGLDNIPRKEKQFRNFTANSLMLRGKNSEGIVGEIWQILKAEREKRQAVKEQQQKEQKEKEEEAKRIKSEEAARESKDKDGSSSEGEEKPKTDENKSDSSIDPKKVHKAMKKVLKKAPNRSMKIKELRKVIGCQLGLPKSARKRLKELVLQAPNSSKKTTIKVDGKIITLV
jgi:cell growth-regulating nucleolar protein